MTYNYDDDTSAPRSDAAGSTTPADSSAGAEINGAPEDAAQQAGQPIDSEAAQDTPAAAAAPGADNPWCEPVYKAAEDTSGVYSPSYHSTEQYTPGTPFPTLDNRTAKTKRRGPNGKKHGFWRAACLVLACVVLSSAACAGITNAILDKRTSGTGSSVVVLGNDTAQTVSDTSSDTSADTSVLTASEIYALGCKQVVGIKTEMTTTNVFGQETSGAVSGSGFVISEDGYILTNYHVVEYAAQGSSLTVMFYGDETTYDATVVAYDEDNDVAVIKIDATGLTPVDFNYNISVGDTVYCVGNPLGELDYTMTSGIVSALDREITTEAGVSINMFQMDAAVNAGNSGGPVYNAYGQVVGIVTAKYSDTGVEGLGFAIPIQDAVNIATELIQNGYVSGKAQLGITGETVSSTAFQYYNLPYGVYVTNVNSGSCAETAGVKIGDIITAINGTDVTSISELKTALLKQAAGDTFELTVYRSGDYLTLTGTLDEKTTSGSSSGTSGETSGSSGQSGESSGSSGQSGQSGGSFPWSK